MTLPTGSLSPEVLSKAVFDSLATALNAIPEGHSHAVLFDGTYSGAAGPSIQALYLQKAPKGWNVVLEGGYVGPLGITGQVVVGKSW